MSTDLQRLHSVFDLAMRVGVGMLTNGAAASEVTATVLRITASSGLRNVSVQVTFDEVAISYLSDAEATPFTRIRSASSRVQDFTRLEDLERITREYVRGDVGLDEAIALAETAMTQRGTYPLWLITVGLAVMGGGAAFSLGAGTLVTLAATFAAAVMTLAIEVLTRERVPAFYIQAVGGFVAVMVAILVSLVAPEQNSSIVVVACIIIQLAGLASIGAMQDAVTGWYVTATARILETLMLTVGLVIGVRAGLLVADLIGADIAVTYQMPITLASVAVIIIAGAVMGIGYAISVQVPARLLLWFSLVAAVSGVVSYVVGQLVGDRVWGVGTASLLAGMMSVLIATRLRAPALTFIMAGVIPLVPGSRIYRGLLGITDDFTSGAAELFGAIEIAVAIAAGGILGQIVMTRLMRALDIATAGFAPVITSPFHTLRRRRRVAMPRRRRRRSAAISMGAERSSPTATGSIPRVAREDGHPEEVP
ncbi:MAG: threonine/serine exporter family protein [Brachybacterium sp.]|nr:threonine/serine exporter family protein [Brachybacterium sp.]